MIVGKRDRASTTYNPYATIDIYSSPYYIITRAATIKQHNMISTTDNANGCSTSFKPFAKQLPIEEVNNYEIDIPAPADIKTEETALQQLKEKLDSIPHEMKSSLVYAQQVKGELVNDDHLLRFLYVEKFDIDVSVYV